MTRSLTLLSLTAVVFASAGFLVGCNSNSGGAGTSAAPAESSSTPPVLPPKTPKPLDISFVPAEAAFALVLDPHQLLDAPNMNQINSSSLPNLVQGDYGIDPHSVELFTLVGGPGKKLGEFFGGAIIRFKDPVDEQGLLATFGPGWEDSAVGERKYHRSTEEGIRSVYFADKNTVVVAADETLKKMLSTQPDAESPLRTTLRKLDDASAALAVLEMAVIRGQIMTFLLFQKLPSPFDKPPMDGVKEIPKNIDEFVVKFEVTPKLLVSATMQGKDEAAAKATDEVITAIIENLSESADKAVEEAAARGGGLAATAGPVALQNLISGFERMEHKLDGSELKLTMSGKSLQNQLTFLSGPLVTPFLKTWQDADRDASIANLVKIGAALDAALAAAGTYPAPASHDAAGKPLLSWRVHLLPQLGYQSLYDQFHLDEPWDSQHNKALIPRMPTPYRVPGHAFDGKTDYLLATGAGTVFAGTEAPQASIITDPKSDTILAVEVFSGKGVEWTKPDDYKFDRADPTAGLTHVVKEYFLALFADGTARSVSAKDGSAAIAALFSAAGGESAEAK